MATFNPDQAVDFGAIMQVLGGQFSPYLAGLGVPNVPPIIYPDSPGAVTAFNYSYGSVFNPVVDGIASAQTGDNVQATLNLFSDPSSLSQFTMSLYQSKGLGTGSISANFYDTSSMVIYAVPEPTGSYNVDLSTATLVANDPTQVATPPLTFTFIPGTTQTLSLTYSTGTTISEANTNGITNTTTNSVGVSTTFAVIASASVTGGVPGDTETDAESVSASINAAWSESSSQSSNYSTTTTNQTNTTTSATVTVNVNTATPNSDGSYSYNGFTLIPGNEYIAEIQVYQSTYSNAVNQTFQISGPGPSTGLSFTGSSNGNQTPTPYQAGGNFSTDQGPESTISTALDWGYSTLSGIDNSQFQCLTGSTDMVIYTGLMTATSVGSEGATVVILPVAVTSDGAPPPSSNVPANAAAMLAPNSNAMVDLTLAASRLHADTGVYFNTASSAVESNLISQYLSDDAATLFTIHGGVSDHAILGNLNYSLNGFTNSHVTVGDGNNVIHVAETENGNRFELGNGNNNIFLNGKGNNFYLGTGANYVEVNGGTGKNFVIANDGPTALVFDSADGFTQVSKWDNTSDSLHFGSNIDLSQVKITFNYNDWSYNVYVQDHLVANLITVGGLSLSDPSTKITFGSAYAPTSMGIKTTEGFLTGLYADAFDRAADSDGLAYWTNSLNHGATRVQIAQAFFTSAEFESNYQNSSQYVSALYHNLLGRAADADGLAFWSGEINAGSSHSSVVNAMLNSAEFVNLVGVNHPA